MSTSKETGQQPFDARKYLDDLPEFAGTYDVVLNTLAALMRHHNTGPLTLETTQKMLEEGTPFNGQMNATLYWKEITGLLHKRIAFILEAESNTGRQARLSTPDAARDLFESQYEALHPTPAEPPDDTFFPIA